jgi:ankyrin repeat protein
MGNVVKKTLKKCGCSEALIEHFFSSNFERIENAVVKGNLLKIKNYHKTKNFDFGAYNDQGDNALHIAAASGGLEIIEYLVTNVKEIKIEDRNFHGDTALMTATMKGDLEIVKYLVKKARCNVDASENRGFTPFMAACSNGFLDIVKFLHKEGKTNYKIRNAEGQTAVHRAAFYGALEVLHYLRKNTSLSFSSKDKKGNTPLHFACQRLNISCARYILGK